MARGHAAYSSQFFNAASDRSSPSYKHAAPASVSASIQARRASRCVRTPGKTPNSLSPKTTPVALAHRVRLQKIASTSQTTPLNPLQQAPRRGANSFRIKIPAIPCVHLTFDVGGSKVVPKDAIKKILPIPTNHPLPLRHALWMLERLQMSDSSSFHDSTVVTRPSESPDARGFLYRTGHFPLL